MTIGRIWGSRGVELGSAQDEWDAVYMALVGFCCLRSCHVCRLSFLYTSSNNLCPFHRLELKRNQPTQQTPRSVIFAVSRPITPSPLTPSPRHARVHTTMPHHTVKSTTAPTSQLANESTSQPTNQPNRRRRKIVRHRTSAKYPQNALQGRIPAL